jgi:hypothetical protein
MEKYAKIQIGIIYNTKQTARPRCVPKVWYRITHVVWKSLNKQLNQYVSKNN